MCCDAFKLLSAGFFFFYAMSSQPHMAQQAGQACLIMSGTKKTVVNGREGNGVQDGRGQKGHRWKGRQGELQHPGGLKAGRLPNTRILIT